MDCHTPLGLSSFSHGAKSRWHLATNIVFATTLLERLWYVQSEKERILQVDQCSMDESRAIRVKNFVKWPQLNRPFYDSRRVRNGKPVFSDISLSIALFWGFWEWMPIMPEFPKAGVQKATNGSNGSNGSNVTLVVRSPTLRGHLSDCLKRGYIACHHKNASNMSNVSVEVPRSQPGTHTWVFQRNWAFASFSEHDKEVPYILATSNSSYVFAANQPWRERTRLVGISDGTISFPSVSCVSASCFEAPREFCQARNREPCGGDESHTCGRCISGFAGEDGGSVWPCSKEGTGGLTINFEEHLCNFMILEGFVKQAWLNGLQLTRRPFAIAGFQTWTSPETAEKGVAVYFCHVLDAWVIVSLLPKIKAGSFAEQIAEIGRHDECPMIAFFGFPHPSMPGGWTESYLIPANVTMGILVEEENVGLMEASNARMTCHSIGDGEYPEWQGRCPTCTIMPKWWFCDGGCEALSLIGLILSFVMLVFCCFKCKLCWVMCWVVEVVERERQVKLGLMDCKDERAPHHMRIAKTGDQRIAVKFFGQAHPDHTIKPMQIQAMKAANKERAEEKRMEEVENELKKHAKPPRLKRFKWWAKDVLAEPDTSRQRVHPLMLAPEPPHIQSNVSTPKGLAHQKGLKDEKDIPDDHEHRERSMLCRMDTVSWREPDRRHEALPKSAVANKDAALQVARENRSVREETHNPARATFGRSSTLRGLADSHRGSDGARMSVDVSAPSRVRALTNGSENSK